MSKFILIILTAVVLILFTSGVIEVQVHPAKLSTIPATLANLVPDEAWLPQAKLQGTRLRRYAEGLIVQDKEKRLDIAQLNVAADAERLAEAIKSGDEALQTGAADLLLASLRQVREAAAEAPVDAVAELKQKAEELAAAREAVKQLKDLPEKHASLVEEYTRLTETLEQQVGELNLPAGESGVAGARDEIDQESIPLQF